MRHGTLVSVQGCQSQQTSGSCILSDGRARHDPHTSPPPSRLAVLSPACFHLSSHPSIPGMPERSRRCFHTPGPPLRTQSPDVTNCLHQNLPSHPQLKPFADHVLYPGLFGFTVCHLVTWHYCMCCEFSVFSSLRGWLPALFASPARPFVFTSS